MLLASLLIPLVAPMLLDMLQPPMQPPVYVQAQPGYAQTMPAQTLPSFHRHDTPMDSTAPRAHPIIPPGETRVPPEKMERGRHYKGHWYKEGEGECWTRHEGRWEWNHARCK